MPRVGINSAARPRRRSSRVEILVVTALCTGALLSAAPADAATAFLTPPSIVGGARPRHHRTIGATADSTNGLADIDDDVARQIAKAKALLKNAKEKMAREAALAESYDDESTPPPATAAAAVADGVASNDEGAIPFFAAKSNADKIKSTSADGLIVADGEKMASLSESEEWEIRPLGDMFRNMIVDEDDKNAAKLAKKDVAVGIYNLRKGMRTEDFMKVFDRRNYFIGDLD